MRVLLAVGDARLAAMHAGYLRGQGFEVVAASSLAQAVEAMDDWTPHVIVLDAAIPCDIDSGISWVSVLLVRPIPVLLLTEPGDTAGAAGVPFPVEACYAKPLTPAELATALLSLPAN
jgi:DNA-binding response OmpR family regulator